MKKRIAALLFILITLGCTKIESDSGGPIGKLSSDSCSVEKSEKICFENDRIEIKQNEMGIFGVTILNEIDSQNFVINVSRPEPGGYTKDKKEIFNDEIEWKPKAKTLYIQSNDEVKIGIGVYIPKNTTRGTYIFKLDIKTENKSSYINARNFYVDVK